jgi:hypothetical protein
MRVRVRANFRELARNGEGEIYENERGELEIVPYEHPGLQANAEHYVLQVDNEYYRVVDCDGEPVLYPKELFEVIDRAVPAGWQLREYDDGAYFLGPTFERPGFYEDWFGSDGDIAAQQTARDLLRQELLRLAEISNDADRRLIEEALARLASGRVIPR